MQSRKSTIILLVSFFIGLSVLLYPAISSYAPPAEYTVIKLWKDQSYSGHRPKSVTVDILKDGTLQETVALSTDNNWSYSWTVSADDPDKKEGVDPVPG